MNIHDNNTRRELLVNLFLMRLLDQSVSSKSPIIGGNWDLWDILHQHTDRFVKQSYSQKLLHIFGN